MKPEARAFVLAIVLSNLVSMALFGLRVVGADNTQYWFLFWNLLLAWVPVGVAYLLVKALETRSWKQPLPMLLTIMWLGFLPNSFYLMSDLIHLENTGDINMLFDIMLFLSCIWNGALAGMISLVMVHRQLLLRRSRKLAGVLMSVCILAVSFAIYLGRDLRWNTWDLLVSPTGLLFDVSERFVHPLDHSEAFLITLTFFALIGSIYCVVWEFVNLRIKKI